MPRTVLLAAYDTTPKHVFQLLCRHLQEDGNTILPWLGTEQINHPAMQHAMRDAVEKCDTALIGMSSLNNAALEMQIAAMCKALGKPFGFFSDTHGAFTREWFAEFRSTARFLLVVSDDEVGYASKLFSGAKVAVTGNPLWAAYFSPASRDDARRAIGVSEHEYLVLAPGTKDKLHNCTVWEATIRAASTLKNRVVVLAKHPGDKNLSNVYEFLQPLGLELGVRTLWFVGSSDAVVPGADLVINGTSIRTHALARLIPVIDYYESTSQDWLEKDIGSRTGHFYGSGAVMDVYNESWEELAAAMHALSQYPTSLRSFQATAVKRVDQKESLAAMLNAII
jgi:hypothetical protein